MNTNNNWIKWSEQIPPTNGTLLLIAMRNKNKEDGIWLYDICGYYGGNPDNIENWNGKFNWETPLYWKNMEEDEPE